MLQSSLTLPIPDGIHSLAAHPEPLPAFPLCSHKKGKANIVPYQQTLAVNPSSFLLFSLIFFHPSTPRVSTPPIHFHSHCPALILELLHLFLPT